MKDRLKKKIFRNLNNPKLHYSLSQLLKSNKNIQWWRFNGIRYFRCYSDGKIIGFKKNKKKMNREIKFRGKDINHGAWIFGDLQQHDDGGVCIGEHDNSWTDDGYHWKTYRQVVEVDEETVGQYTGLKDKNGNEIYPGDVLFSKGKIIGYVVDGVRAYCYDVMYINHPCGERRWSLWATVTVDYEGDIEVKGNIHDNPELIRKEEPK